MEHMESESERMEAEYRKEHLEYSDNVNNCHNRCTLAPSKACGKNKFLFL